MLVLDPATSARLAAVRQRDTGPELRVRALLRVLGLRYRIRNRDLPGSPDIANRRHRWAIFVHGCFWHGHRGCRRATVPKRNAAFWTAKLDANRARDERALRALRRSRFKVVVVWACELDRHPSRVVARLSRLQEAGQPRGKRES